MKDAYYFPHDSNSRNDPKIAVLRAEFGLAGYAMFFMIIEILRDQANYSYPIRGLYSLPIAMGIENSQDLDVGVFDKFIEKCCELDLLQKDDKWLTCRTLTNRMQPLEKCRVAGKLGAEKRWHSHPNSTPMAPQCHPNSSKVKESKEKNIYMHSLHTEFVKPTVSEVASYCKERQNGVDAQKFCDFYEAKGWMIGKNKIKDWKACVRTWERQEEKKEERYGKF